MTRTSAKEIITGDTPDCSREEIRRAWQFLVDDGTIWAMPKRFGDLAACMIQAGTLERNAAE